MSPTPQDLRDLMHQRAAGSPEPPSRLEAVERRVTGIRRRRRATAAAGVGMVVLAAVLVAPTLLHRAQGSSVAPATTHEPQPSARASGAPAPEPSPAPAMNSGPLGNASYSAGETLLGLVGRYIDVNGTAPLSFFSDGEVSLRVECSTSGTITVLSGTARVAEIRCSHAYTREDVPLSRHTGRLDLRIEGSGFDQNAGTEWQVSALQATPLTAPGVSAYGSYLLTAPDMGSAWTQYDQAGALHRICGRAVDLGRPTGHSSRRLTEQVPEGGSVDQVLVEYADAHAAAAVVERFRQQVACQRYTAPDMSGADASYEVWPSAGAPRLGAESVAAVVSWVNPGQTHGSWPEVHVMARVGRTVTILQFGNGDAHAVTAAHYGEAALAVAKLLG